MRLGRRGFGRLVAAAAAGTLAGCGGGSGIAAAEYEDPALRLVGGRLPQRVQLNPYSLAPRGRAYWVPIQQLVLPTVEPTGEHLTSGHAVEVGGREVTVPTAVADYELDPPDGYTLTFDDRLTYWNGDPLDARAFVLRRRAYWLINGGKLEGEPFEFELLDRYRLRRRFAGPGRNRARLLDGLHPGAAPLPPGFLEPHVETLEEATTEDAVLEAANDLGSVSLDFTTLADEGWGTGAYAVESSDDVFTDGLLAHRREDHPGDPAAATLVLLTGGSYEGTDTGLVGSGRVDLGVGIVGEGADFTREGLPDAIRQVDRWPDPTRPGVLVAFSWSGPTRRLWLRRAVVAALPGEELLATTWGAGTVPPTTDAGLLSAVDRVALDGDLRAALHDYPVAADPDRAREWLERAGYERAGGSEGGESWVGPEGAPLSLALLVPAGDAAADTASRVARNGLEAVGIGAEVERFRGSEYTRAIREGGYDLAVGSTHAGPSPTAQLTPPAALSGQGLVAPPVAVPAGAAVADGSGGGTPPFVPPGRVSLPAEPGALAIEGVDYPDGGTAYRVDAGETVSVAGAVDGLADPGADAAALAGHAAVCARWYNYAIPGFLLGQRAAGVWGNVERLAFPEPPATRAVRGDATGHHYYAVQAGTARPVAGGDSGDG